MPPAFPFTPTFHTSVYPSIDPKNAALSAKGKVVLVTGGGRGIGKSIAISFATAGAHIIILGRTPATLSSAVADISASARQHGHHEAIVTSFTADVCEQDQVKEAFVEARKRFGRIDVVVNNAGDLYLGTLQDADPTTWWKSFEINVKGTLNVVQAMLSGGGSEPATFINVSTVGIGMKGWPGWSAYTASKLAAFKMTSCLTADAPHIRSFSINPGRIETDMSKTAGLSDFDDAELPGAFCVWLAGTEKARFLQSRLLSANWDVEELLGMEEEIVKGDLLEMKIQGLKM